MDPTARLRKIDPAKWTVDDVGVWLDYIHLSEHRAEFTKQSVSGSELIELDVDDLLELHVTKMGHRKKLVSHIKMLKHGLDGAYATNTDDGSSEGSTTGFTRTGGSASSGSRSSTTTKGHSEASGKLNFKCYVGDDISVLHLSANVSYSQLKSKLRKEYGAKMVVQYKDLDGDKIRIKKTSHLKAAIDECKGTGVIKLYLRERKKKVSVREQSILDTMLDAVVTINTAGRVCFFNTAAEKLFGYSRGEVVKQNVRMLMPNEVAEHHDRYLKDYQQSRVGKIIGVGRVVQAKHKDGHLFSVRLTVTESVQATGDTIYTGTLAKIAEVSTNTASMAPITASDNAVVRNPMFDLLDKMVDAMLVINETGIIQFLNVAAEAKFGWKKEEAIGRNVKILMPKDVGDVHDAYLKRYLETKSARIIGVGREVVAQRKDGSMFPVYLSVTEQALDAGRRLFTGVIRNVEETVERTKTVLQQQREVVDGLSVAGIIIDQIGKIHAFNEAAQKMLGYRLIDVVSRNLSILMPSEYARVHTDYITTYLKTGQAKVIGVGRDVPVVRKDGTLMGAHLTVTEKRDGEKVFFVGILQPK